MPHDVGGGGGTCQHPVDGDVQNGSSLEALRVREGDAGKCPQADPVPRRKIERGIHSDAHGDGDRGVDRIGCCRYALCGAKMARHR